MSEFDKLKNDAERYAEEHPDQVHKAEQGAEREVEKKLGIGGQEGQGGQQDPGGQDPGLQQGQQGQADPAQQPPGD